MKIAAKYLFLCFLTMFCLNCLPVLVGGLIYQSTKTKQEKQIFLTKFQQNNLEREKAGLLPLDLCIAKYQFDKGWAAEDTACKEKIAAYERGEIDEYGKTIKKNVSQPAPPSGQEKQLVLGFLFH